MEKPSEVRLCKCHGEAMGWAKDKSKAGGRWYCRIRRREWQRQWTRTRYANDPEFRAKKIARETERYGRPEVRAAKLAWFRDRYTNDPEWRESRRDYNREYNNVNADRLRESRLDYYHNRGGWAVKRRRELAGQRTRVLEQLEQLAEEAAAC